MIRENYWKPTRKNDFLLWFHRRILRVASWVLRFVDTYPCDKCALQDDYGCLQDLTLGAPCMFEPKIHGSVTSPKSERGEPE